MTAATKTKKTRNYRSPEERLAELEQRQAKLKARMKKKANLASNAQKDMGKATKTLREALDTVIAEPTEMTLKAYREAHKSFGGAIRAILSLDIPMAESGSDDSSE